MARSIPSDGCWQVSLVTCLPVWLFVYLTLCCHMNTLCVLGTMGMELQPGEFQKEQGSLYSVTSDFTVTKHLEKVINLSVSKWGQRINRLDWYLTCLCVFLFLPLYLSCFQVGISNGMDWTSDQRTFFYIDSLCLTVDAFDYDSSTGLIGTCVLIHTYVY